MDRMMLARDAFSRGPDLCFLVVKFDPLVRRGHACLDRFSDV